jgi:hypothetical protein
MSVAGFLKLASVVVLMLASACASATSAGGAQPSPPGQAQTDVVLEGHLEVLIEDSDRGSRTLYFLISSDSRVPLRFSVDPPNLTSGTRVRVRGSWEADGTFVVGAIEKAP